jgi:hypothetical protein
VIRGTAQDAHGLQCSFFDDRSQQNYCPQIAELAEKACELLAQQDGEYT